MEPKIIITLESKNIRTLEPKFLLKNIIVVKKINSEVINMTDKRENPEFTDEDSSEDIIEDWAILQPYDYVEREIFHSTINKNTKVIIDNGELQNEEENVEKIKINDENKAKSSSNNIDRLTRVMSEEEGQSKRSYLLRNVTIRRMGELKLLHPDINIPLNRIIDMALNHYYYYIKEGGKFREY
ncbi:hypothetical protein [Clostridium intestinale]|uniref:Uncharacterized protein n=1 Tax=Clostridium intestinale TaxID=36845 RepID=A0A7D6ZE55_9CLOT|nr:hypothetical protein [Clostridium intestinale]QLY77901.1 hypothetical protein HZF06_12375 [Clostridium intestinale]